MPWLGTWELTLIKLSKSGISTSIIYGLMLTKKGGLLLVSPEGDTTDAIEAVRREIGRRSEVASTEAKNNPSGTIEAARREGIEVGKEIALTEARTKKLIAAAIIAAGSAFATMIIDTIRLINQWSS